MSSVRRRDRGPSAFKPQQQQQQQQPNKVSVVASTTATTTTTTSPPSTSSSSARNRSTKPLSSSSSSPRASNLSSKNNGGGSDHTASESSSYSNHHHHHAAPPSTSTTTKKATTTTTTAPKNSPTMSTSPLSTSSPSSSNNNGNSNQHVGLRSVVQRRFLRDVLETAIRSSGGTSGSSSSSWKVLVVDERSMYVINSAVGMYDVMERGHVTIVESITKKRAPFHDMNVIYLLDPNEDSIRRLLDDYKDPKKVLYGKEVYLFFLNRIDDTLLNKIKQCKPLLRRLKALQEINIDFIIKEERAYTLSMETAFLDMYLRHTQQPIELKIAEKLVTLCATLNEYPHIRYSHTSPRCISLASCFHLKMDEYVLQNPNWWYHGGPTTPVSSNSPSNNKQHRFASANNKNAAVAQRERGTLLLLDRSEDCLTPFMHDFTYQALVNDVLSNKITNDDVITFQTESNVDPTKTEDKDAVLDDRDNVWVDIRGMHIADVIETLSGRIRDVMNSSTGNAVKRTGRNDRKGGGGMGDKQASMTLSQMSAALRALPEYKEVMSKLSQHMHIAHDCMNIVTTQNLVELSDLEQTLATGKDDEGRTPKLNDIIDNVVHNMLHNTYLQNNIMAKLRLLLITIISQNGLRIDDRKRIIEASKLTNHQLRILNALETFGLSISNIEKKSFMETMFTGRKVKEYHTDDIDSEFVSSRYVPPIKNILQDLANDSLSMEDFPSLLPMPEPAPKTITNTTTSSIMNYGSNNNPSRHGASARARQPGDAVSARKKTSGTGTGGGNATDRWSKAPGSGGGGGGDPTSSLSDSNSNKIPNKFHGGRSLVFMMGGLSYAELRCSRQVMIDTSHEIIIGSTKYITSHTFMNDLQILATKESEPDRSF